MKGKDPNPEIMEYTNSLIQLQLELLEEIIDRSDKKGGKYLTGKNLTIADLQIFYQCTSEFFWDRDFKAYPKIDAWMGRMLKIKEVKEIHD